MTYILGKSFNSTNNPKTLKIITNDGNNNVALHIEWGHFNGSVLDMQEKDFIYGKQKMIDAEYKAVKEEHDYAFYKTGDMYPRSCWSEIAEVTKEHLEKLEKLKNSIVNNNTPTIKPQKTQPKS